MKRTALILENDYSVDSHVLAYVEDVVQFDKVKELSYAKDRQREVAELLQGSEITDILGCSTFMWKDQLENTVRVLMNTPPKSLHFTLASYYLNKFLTAKSWIFNDIVTLNASLKNIVKDGKIFEICETWEYVELGNIVPNNHMFLKDGKRRKMEKKQVHYSDEHNVFYLEGEDFPLEHIAKTVHNERPLL